MKGALCGALSGLGFFSRGFPGALPQAMIFGPRWGVCEGLRWW
jgi:hypothetical protein